MIWAYPNVNQHFSSKSQSECLSVCPVLFRFQQLCSMASWKTSWDVGPEGFGRGEGGGQAGAAASRVTMVLAGASAGGGGGHQRKRCWG